MLSIFLAEELERVEKESRDTVFIEYFCDNKDEKRNTAVGILRGLVFQLLNKRKELFTHIIPTFRIQKDSLFTEPSFGSLWTCFEAMVRDASVGTVFTVVDGLDECDEPLLEVLLKRFRALFSTSTNLSPSTNRCHLNLIVVSRERPDFVAKELLSFPRIRLGLDAGTDVDRDVQNDVIKFIAVKVDELSKYRNYPPQLRSFVENAFYKRAEGTFLWVGIVAKELENYTYNKVKDALVSFPQGLFQLYSRILLQIPPRRQTSTAKILQWVVMATRPLTLRELDVVLRLADDASLGLTCKAAALEQMKNCGHLLTITRGKVHQEVRLIYQSAKDYLLCETCDPDPDLESLRVKKEVANYQIAKQCLDYLQGDALVYGYVNLRKDQQYKKAFPLLAYATLHWFEHARCLSDPDLDVFDLSLPFYADPSPVRESWLWTYKSQQEYSILPSSLPLLHVTSYFGIIPLAEKLLCKSTQLEYQRLEINHKDHIEMSTALHWAAKSGHEAIVRLLLVKGADPEAKDYEGRTVLFQAAQLKNQKITQLLLYRGVNVNAQDKNGQTALHQAAQNQNETAVQLLLKHEADPNVKDGDEQTALHLAAPTGKAVVQLLLERKADPNAKNKERRTALHIAGQFPNEVVIEILLEHRADPHARDRYGQTAWDFAIEHGYGEVIQLLIRHGADLNARDEYGQTLLHLATWHGHEKVKQLLIEHRADPNARDRHGRTALQLAIDLKGDEGVPQSEFSHAKASQRKAIMRMLRDVTAANNKDERQMRYPDLEDVVSRVEQALSSSHLIGGFDDDDGNDNDNDSDPIVIGQGSVAWHVLSDACRPEH
jgi:ankyrin repeat protein